MLTYGVSNAFWWLLIVSTLFSAVSTSVKTMGDSLILEALQPKNQPFGPLRMYRTFKDRRDMGMHVYENLDHFFAVNPQPDLWLATTKAPRDYTQAEFRENCWLMFGKETAGLPEQLRLAHYDRCIRIPMRPDARSLNLANSVAILTYEALRQQGFPQLSGVGEMAGQGR